MGIRNTVYYLDWNVLSGTMLTVPIMMQECWSLFVGWLLGVFQMPFIQ